MGGGGYGGTNSRRLNNVYVKDPHWGGPHWYSLENRIAKEYPKLTQWGDPVWGTAERGITTYRLSWNRQRAMGGAGHAAIFNTWRRSKAQILYWAPPLIGAYYLMTWANEQNEWVNSKEGRLATAGNEE
ncbi:Alpha/beta hydrolase fold-1 [Lasiodiplodia theobromae]|uniref:Cytochrome b-c1 complex subunit 8 n=1 Tax=Lasiodiplodia hormozganensis TaxID=869390 RepID=A0AA39WGA0_9PEZI|nr:Alpha/beta hydrolase fold-1 [Lasiodiplodia theobromae]KAK0614833.1 Cytochrome b-c1 complex subunit 8 [Lasiodiplodia hormozganensis]